MKWVNPNDEMPKRYIAILIAIQYPQHNRAFTITTGIYTGDRMMVRRCQREIPGYRTCEILGSDCVPAQGLLTKPNQGGE